jgi:hypothetical protein
MKKLILAVIMSLAVAGGMKEAGAAACCCSISMGAGIPEGSKGAMPGDTDCMTLEEKADHEGTRGPRDLEVQGNSEATGSHSDPHQHGPANEAGAPMVEEDSR